MSDCHCPKGHILQKVHTLPRATLALEILALGPKTFPFLISMGRRDLSPSGSGLAWVPIFPRLVLAQTSMKENLVALPQGFPEMSLPYPHPQPTKEYSFLPTPDPMGYYPKCGTARPPFHPVVGPLIQSPLLLAGEHPETGKRTH